jgi:hypothetical protein
VNGPDKSTTATGARLVQTPLELELDLLPDELNELNVFTLWKSRFSNDWTTDDDSSRSHHDRAARIRIAVVDGNSRVRG